MSTVFEKYNAKKKKKTQVERWVSQHLTCSVGHSIAHMALGRITGVSGHEPQPRAHVESGPESGPELAGALYRYEFSFLKERNRTDRHQALLRKMEVRGGHQFGLKLSDIARTAVCSAHPPPPNKAAIWQHRRDLGLIWGFRFQLIWANSLRVAV